MLLFNPFSVAIDDSAVRAESKVFRFLLLFHVRVDFLLVSVVVLILLPRNFFGLRLLFAFKQLILGCRYSPLAFLKQLEIGIVCVRLFVRTGDRGWDSEGLVVDIRMIDEQGLINLKGFVWFGCFGLPAWFEVGEGGFNRQRFLCLRV